MDDDQSVANREPTAWLVTQKPDSKYRNRKAASYEFPRSIPNGAQVDEGDTLVVYVPKGSGTPEGVIGVGRIGSIKKGKKDRRVAKYDRYIAFSDAVSLEDLGGDPRSNKRNAINSLESGFFKDVLLHAGFDTVSSGTVASCGGSWPARQVVSNPPVALRAQPIARVSCAGRKHVAC